jgi:cytochrome b subunit of formate dehydrogenase
MLKKIIVSLIVTTILGLAIWWVKNIDFVLFMKAPWALIASTVLAISLGVIRAAVNTRSYEAFISVERHTVGSFLGHWGTGAGIFLLMYSGFHTSSGGLFAMNLHFLGIVVTMFFGFYFLTDFLISKKYRNLLPDETDIIKGTIGKYFFRSNWYESGKYLSSQKAAFLSFALIGSEIAVTGAIKAIAFVNPIPLELVKIATTIHDISSGVFVLLLAVHILLVITVKSHRRLLRFWISSDRYERDRETEVKKERTEKQLMET